MDGDLWRTGDKERNLWISRFMLDIDDEILCLMMSAKEVIGTPLVVMLDKGPNTQHSGGFEVEPKAQWKSRPTAAF